MDLRDELPEFITKLDNEPYTRGAIVLLCVNKIRNAADIESMESISTCEVIGDNVYFTYNGACKLYFKHHPDEVTARAWEVQA